MLLCYEANADMKCRHMPNCKHKCTHNWIRCHRVAEGKECEYGNRDYCHRGWHYESEADYLAKKQRDQEKDRRVKDKRKRNKLRLHIHMERLNIKPKDLRFTREFIEDAFLRAFNTNQNPTLQESIIRAFKWFMKIQQFPQSEKPTADRSIFGDREQQDPKDSSEDR